MNFYHSNFSRAEFFGQLYTALGQQTHATECWREHSQTALDEGKIGSPQISAPREVGGSIYCHQVGIFQNAEFNYLLVGTDQLGFELATLENG